MGSFQIFSKPKEIYTEMLRDIKNARKSVYLETYIYDNDKIGRKFRDALVKKASEGVKIKVLVDSFGSTVRKDFFKKLVKNGGEVRFFKEVRYVIRIFSKNHERNHRKILIIDDCITYIGSINITSSCLNWRELVLRFNEPLTEHFIESFNYSWDSFQLISEKKIELKIHRGFEILHDIPRDPRKMTQSKYSNLIKDAKKEILIETPYFVPPVYIRLALRRAVKRGVEVKILLPYNSDVRLMDVFRNRYLGRLHKSGVKILFYMPKILHSKLLIVDNKFFLLGSSNLDYASFVNMHEINLFGKDRRIIAALKEFYNAGLKNSEPFSYEDWKKRSSIRKIAELVFTTIEEYL